jgi:hypothetical protein
MRDSGKPRSKRKILHGGVLEYKQQPVLADCEWPETGV